MSASNIDLDGAYAVPQPLKMARRPRLPRGRRGIERAKGGEGNRFHNRRGRDHAKKKEKASLR